MNILNSLRKTSDILISISKVIVIALVALMASIIFLQIILRSFFNSSIIWAEEVTRFMFVWVTYFGASIALRSNRHIGVNVLRDKFPPHLKFWVLLFTRVLMLAVVILLIYFGWGYAILNMQFASPGLRIPLFYPKAGIIIALVFMFVHIIYLLFTMIVKRKEEK